MTLVIAKKKGPAIVVRYRLPVKSAGVRYFPRVFLSSDRQFKFRLALAFKNADLAVELISPLISHFSKSPIFKFTLSATETKQIQDVEAFLDKPGRVVYLIGEAKRAKNKKAHENELSVSLEDLEAMEDFADFSPEGESEELVSGMKFYEYTETAHALLNDVVAGYTRLAFKEKKKELPDTGFLAELEANKILALNLLRQSKTFASLDEMSEVITEYTPIVRALYDRNSSSSLPVF